MKLHCFADRRPVARPAVPLLAVPLLAALLLVAVALAGWPALAAGKLTQPQGPVIITVHGKIANANRGALDAFDDAFLKSAGAGFDKAVEFDRAMLQKLGMHTVMAKHSTWQKAHRIEGPLLADVLKAAGATGGVATVYALDGYGAKIPLSDLKAWPVVLGLKADGRWLGIGGRGPAWVVYPPADKYPALKDADDSKWVWSAFHIEVE
jgi:hypothetical protein